MYKIQVFLKRLGQTWARRQYWKSMKFRPDISNSSQIIPIFLINYHKSIPCLWGLEEKWMLIFPEYIEVFPSSPDITLHQTCKHIKYITLMTDWFQTPFETWRLALNDVHNSYPVFRRNVERDYALDELNEIIAPRFSDKTWSDVRPKTVLMSAAFIYKLIDSAFVLQGIRLLLSSEPEIM